MHLRHAARRTMSFILILMLITGSAVFAADPITLERPVSVSSESSKYQGFEDYNPNDSSAIRVILEFKEEPLIESATAFGLHVNEMEDTQVASLKAEILSEQENVMHTIQKQVGNLEVHQRFFNVVNGISTTVTPEALEALGNIPKIKAIHRVNTYERPAPLMVNSRELTQAVYANEHFGYKGEGLVVAILDTGLDPFHQDYKIDEGARGKVALTEETVKRLIAEKGLKGVYFNEKVPYGYNYADRNTRIKDVGPNADKHGAHVGGTVAANGIIKGLAPNAQLLGMNVFGNDPNFRSTYADILIAAIDDGIALGAHVMNLSLGAPSSYVDTTDPEQMAITRAVENGVFMSIASGNHGHFGNGNAAKAGFPYATNPDIGTTGSPGLVKESLSVASIDNLKYAYSHKVNAPGLSKPLEGFGLDQWTVGDYPLIQLKGNRLGVAPDNYEGIDVKGKVVLVSRGLYPFVDKIGAAKARGAAGVICYNNVAGEVPFKDLGGLGIPFMLTSLSGFELEGLLTKQGGEMTVSVSDPVNHLDPKTGQSSYFSSWGTTPDLNFKPDISTPGGGIYSTLEDNQYGWMSGTSMATPHGSAGAALVLQRLMTTQDFSELRPTKVDRVKLAKTIMMNTARPVVQGDWGNDVDEFGNVITYKLYTSPRRQGAGAMDLKSATLTDVVVYDKASGRTYQGSVGAGEVDKVIHFTLTAYNQSDEAVTYDLGATVQTNRESNGFNILEPMLLFGTTQEFLVNGQPVTSLTIPSKGTTDVEVYINIENAFLPDTNLPFNAAFPNGNFVEGFVFLYPREAQTHQAIEDLKASYLAKVQGLGDLEAQLTQRTALLASKKTDLDALKLDRDAAKVLWDKAVEDKAADEVIKKLEVAYLLLVEKIKVLELEITTLADGIVVLESNKASLTAELEAIKEQLVNQTLKVQKELPLSIPYMGFKGDWSKAPAFDGKQGEPTSFYNLTNLTVAHTNGTPSEFMGAVSAFSPNADGTCEMVAPAFSLLRNLKDVTYEIRSAQGSTLRVLGKKTALYKNIHDIGYRDPAFYDNVDMTWDGKINLKVAKEGQYHYVVTGKLEDKNKSVQTLSFPVILDNTAPLSEGFTFTDTLNAMFKDSLSGVARYALYKKDAKAQGGLVLIEDNNVNGHFDIKSKVMPNDQVIAYAYDHAGNLGKSEVFTIDAKIPALDVVQPGAYVISRLTTVPVKGTVTDASPFTVYVDGAVVHQQGTASDKPVPFSTTYTSDKWGKHSVRVTAVDLFNNSYELTRKFYIDPIAPRLLVKAVHYNKNLVTPVNGVYRLPVGAKEIEVTLEAAENFPDLDLYINDSQVDKVAVNWFASESLIKPMYLEKRYTVALDEDEAVQPLVAKVTDVAGWINTLGLTIVIGDKATENIYGSLTGYSTSDGSKDIPQPMPLGLIEKPADTQPSTDPQVPSGPQIPSGPQTPVIPWVPLEGGKDKVEGAPKNDKILILNDPVTSLGAISTALAFIQGYPSGQFKPDVQVKRGEFAKMLATMMALEVKSQEGALGTGAGTYKDTGNHWAKSYIQALVSANILMGYKDQSFKPDQFITRAEVASALVNAWRYKGINFSSAKAPFNDIETIEDSAAIGVLFAQGVLAGYPDQSFRPNQGMTRAEAVKTLNIYTNRKVDEASGTQASFTDIANHWAKSHILAASQMVTTAK